MGSRFNLPSLAALGMLLNLFDENSNYRHCVPVGVSAPPTTGATWSAYELLQDGYDFDTTLAKQCPPFHIVPTTEPGDYVLRLKVKEVAGKSDSGSEL